MTAQGRASLRSELHPKGRLNNIFKEWKHNGDKGADQLHVVN